MGSLLSVGIVFAIPQANWLVTLPSKIKTFWHFQAWGSEVPSPHLKTTPDHSSADGPSDVRVSCPPSPSAGLVPAHHCGEVAGEEVTLVLQVPAWFNSKRLDLRVKW